MTSLYRRAFEETWIDAADLDSVRFVVLDCETTGTDPERDRLISIGAVAVLEGEIRLEDSFEALMKIEYNASSVTVHGITREEAADGMDEPDALRDFLEYLQDGVIVGHHIGHDLTALNRACRRHFDFELANRWLDTMDLALHLEGDGAFVNDEPFRSFTLDTLCDRFAIEPHDRHTAAGDAFITAQIFLKLLPHAKRHARGTLGALCERFVPPDPET